MTGPPSMHKSNDPNSPEPHFKVAEVAALYKVTPRTVRNWIEDGRLRALKRGRIIRVPKSALDDFNSNN